MSIRFLKKVVLGKLYSRYRGTTRRKYSKELKVLNSLLETDTSVLPAVIKFQDRGRMRFPHNIYVTGYEKRAHFAQKFDFLFAIRRETWVNKLAIALCLT